MRSDDARGRSGLRLGGVRPVGGPRPWLTALVMAGVVAWAVALVAAPYTFARHDPAAGAAFAAAGVYAIGSLICHQQPARSFHPWGRKLPVCARCAGLYGGALGGLLFFPWPAGARRTRAVIALTAIPTAVTFVLELVGVWDPGNAVRFAAALPLGASGAWFVVAAARGAVR